MITLYHGDNGKHEFYESETRHRGRADLIIIRHHGSPNTEWFVLESAYIDWKRLPSGPLSAVIRAFTERTNRPVEVSPHREWRDQEPRFAGDNMRGMELASV